MKIYGKDNVYDAAIKRINYLYDEFDTVAVAFSGGKDSTVVLNLCLEVATRRGLLPVPCLFIDQEAEWEGVINYIRVVMNDPRIKSYWMQIPFKIFNATSHENEWLNCWGGGEQWLREKEAISIKENIYGTERFAELFKNIVEVEFKENSCLIGGVRSEETPARHLGLVTRSTYKHITYGKRLNLKKKLFTFYPIYDWSFRDVWKYIEHNKISYCNHYDSLYQNGIAIPDMRVSNLNHETALYALKYLPEIEGALWDKLLIRMPSLNNINKNKIGLDCPEDVPEMFNDWVEYRDYLLINLIKVEHQPSFISVFKKYDPLYIDEPIKSRWLKCCINSIIINDYFLSKIKNFLVSPPSYSYLKYTIKNIVSTKSNISIDAAIKRINNK